MAISHLVAEGYKSLRERTVVEFSKLTVLAGANSSGKSSVMHAALLLKQTFEAGYDPGPLLISGPNVVFSETEQMFWAAAGEPRKDHFRLGIGVEVGEQRSVSVEVVLGRGEDRQTPLAIAECEWSLKQGTVSLREDMSAEEVDSLIAVPEEELERLYGVLRINGDEEEDDPKQKVRWVVRRNRALLGVFLETPAVGLTFVPSPIEWGIVGNAIQGIIHVPGLRGNPRRTYPMTAVEERFPGLFQDYVASVIAQWQRSDRAKLDQLGYDLRKLGLTWKVRARQKSDTEVEILVGRLPVARRGGSRDLVSIADVGFGFSQSFPVAVALLAGSEDQMVYLEQPEIHLHPRAQLALAGLIQRAVERGVQVVVETHSLLLLMGIQQAVASGKIKTGEACLHWFDRDEFGRTHVISADLDEHGAFGDVPVDFADVDMEAMSEYLEAAAGGDG